MLLGNASRRVPAFSPSLRIAFALSFALNGLLLVSLVLLLLHGPTTDTSAWLTSLLSSPNAPLGSATATSAPVLRLQEQQYFFNQLERAEATYKRNRQRRSVLVGTDEEQLIPLQGEALASFERVRQANLQSVYLKEYLLVPQYPCLEEERVGMWGEGGKWICLQALHKAPEDIVIYSIGCGGDSTFEEGMWELLKVKSHVFDAFLTPDEQARTESQPFVHFHPYALSQGNGTTVHEAQKNRDGAAKGIHAIMAELGHKFVDIFKIDCDGCEVEFLDYLTKTSSPEKPLFGQILLEAHSFENLHVTSVYMKQLHDLGFRLFHMEPNFFSTNTCFELAFIHQSLCAQRRDLELPN